MTLILIKIKYHINTIYIHQQKIYDLQAIEMYFVLYQLGILPEIML